MTGGNSGLGLKTAKRIVRLDHHVILACRNVDKGNAAAEAIISETGSDNLEVW
ncbi:MAG: hypothetical protein Q4A55_05360 [Aerococcus sp.]|nr:hypothetical protein [Aerococcus sp.]